MLQNRANEMYPGLFRDINLSSSRYNQHVSNGAFIIEVGTTGNTFEEARNSMKCFSNVIESFK
jgi:stage II sporulation protein P